MKQIYAGNNTKMTYNTGNFQKLAQYIFVIILI